MRRPDIIVTDVMMPVMDGVDFYQRLKGNSETCSIPVIIITVKDKLEESFRAVGVNGFLAKPFEIEDLIATIEIGLDDCKPMAA